MSKHESTSETLTQEQIKAVENSMPEDAKRAREIAIGLGEIMKRNKWNGVCCVLCATSPDTNGEFGFTMIHDIEQIMQVGETGIRVMQAAMILQKE